MYSPSRVFSRPWHLLQWIKDPKEWINNIATKRHSGDAPFQPDALLFPSNWPPLHVLSCVSIIRAICMNMAKKRNSGSLMRNTCVQLALYEEWNRVFLKEKRVALGAVVHIVLFLALLNLVFVITVVDGVAAVLMTPTVLACLVSSWMNILLFKERLLLQKKSSRRLTRGDGHGKNRSAIQF